MGKRIALLAGLLSFVLLLTGCKFSLSSLGLGKVEDIFSDNPIVCTITAIDQSIFTVQVLSADSHYDEEDILLLDCASVRGAAAFRVGDIITFSYDYLNDVTVRNDAPYIVPESVAATEYTPPTTEETGTDN